MVQVCPSGCELEKTSVKAIKKALKRKILNNESAYPRGPALSRQSKTNDQTQLFIYIFLFVVEIEAKCLRLFVIVFKHNLKALLLFTS